MLKDCIISNICYNTDILNPFCVEDSVTMKSFNGINNREMMVLGMIANFEPMGSDLVTK